MRQANWLAATLGAVLAGGAAPAVTSAAQALQSLFALDCLSCRGVR